MTMDALQTKIAEAVEASPDRIAATLCELIAFKSIVKSDP